MLSAVLSADGQWALSGGWDKTVRLWDLSSGNCQRIFAGHKEAVKSVALSADGRWVLSGSDDRTLRLWEVSSGKCLKIFEGHTGKVHSVALSRDGRWALSASEDKCLRLWELDWLCEFPESKDWDEGARGVLESCFALHCARGEDGVTRVGKPTWGQEDFEQLLIELQNRGLGWLRPEGVRRQAEKMISEWNGPPLMPWELELAQNDLHVSKSEEYVLGADLLAESRSNLDRWKSSDEPELWVRKHLQGWNDDEWHVLMASLRKSEYWPAGRDRSRSTSGNAAGVECVCCRFRQTSPEWPY